MSGDESGRFPLSKNRFLTVSQFKGKVRVDIREFYLNDEGERKPGKKGISLSRDEWDKIKEQMDDIDKAVRKQDGESGSDDSD